ncbi:Bifunctional NAD(P)H-hydrate repair enzyme Nnr [Paraliobacillus sp. PM-2]|uniref:NAD(P)H-hydrate dehydratase n=1 Tax=Paraliobacillus sp. PM-2 TaxID=1462524 RepID=UPI00061C5D3B|nr:NAD(P)H-hydrate dehydratase [Paraliobacillus sp. PM-2]CQR48271.1 Bifunctional NAD(P)H-hydrate repair enzyme Nnr [Paraliobacillus sp. PM-2]
MYIVTASEMYEIDRITMEEKGLDGSILMENAGQAVAEKIKQHISKNTSVLILVGSGNNGGDGYVIARSLYNQGYQIRIMQLVSDEKVVGDAAYHKRVLEHFGVNVERYDSTKAMEVMIEQADVIVDAMFGIGVKGSLRSPFKEVVTSVNASGCMTISVDIPSGVPADGGGSVEEVICADYTYIIEAPKLSAFLSKYAPYYGKWDVVQIGLPIRTISHQINRGVWQAENVQATLPKRLAFSHKGTHGKGIIVGGSGEMPGSITMTAKAALRSGVGLLTIATVERAISSVAAQCPEVTFHSLKGQEGEIINQPFDVLGYDACAIGMGMGRTEEAGLFTIQLLKKADIPMIIDADGLNHLNGRLELLSARESPTILTPHPGEMAALLECSVSEVMDCPFNLAKEFAQTYQVYLVLKGTYTIITTPTGKQWVNMTGNAGLAKGGSGDTLAGIMLALIMQKQSIESAIANSCFIHGKAADKLVNQTHSTYDLLATDVSDALPSVFRTFLD